MSANIILQQDEVITLPPDLDQRLTELAKSTGKSKAFYALEAIENYLEDLEDVADAENALEEFYASGEKTIPLEAMERRLGLEN